MFHQDSTQKHRTSLSSDAKHFTKITIFQDIYAEHVLEWLPWTQQRNVAYFYV